MKPAKSFLQLLKAKLSVIASRLYLAIWKESHLSESTADSVVQLFSGRCQFFSYTLHRELKRILAVCHGKEREALEGDVYVLPLSIQSATGKQEHLYKVLVIGDLGTGKTSIIKRYVHQFFSPHYRATVSSLKFIVNSFSRKLMSKV